MSETRIRRLPHYLYRFFVYGIGGLVTTFMILPIFLTLLMSVTSGQTLRFPPEGLSLHWYADLLNPVISHTEQVATFNSLKIAVLAVLGSFCLTVPAAIGMTHLRGRTAVFLEPVLLAPLVLPSLIYGLAALIVANAVGIRPSFGLTVIGHIVTFSPLMYRATSVIAQDMDRSLEHASTMLGASAFTTLRRVLLSILLPGIAVGAFLVFIDSMDNVSISLFLADAQTTVLPLRMFALIEESLDARVAAISGLLIFITLAGVVVGRQILSPSRAQE